MSKYKINLITINKLSQEFHKISEFKQKLCDEYTCINHDQIKKLLITKLSNFYKCISNTISGTNIQDIINDNKYTNKYFVIIDKGEIYFYYKHDIDGLNIELVFKILIISLSK